MSQDAHKFRVSELSVYYYNLNISMYVILCYLSCSVNPNSVSLLNANGTIQETFVYQHKPHAPFNAEQQPFFAYAPNGTAEVSVICLLCI